MKPSTVFDHRSGEHLDIDGASIYYEAIGSESRPALLFLQGGFGNLEDFNPLLPELDREYRLIGIDSRGHGKSTLGPKPLTYELLQSDVERVLRHLGIDAVSVIGFSDGGIVALRLAAFTGVNIEKLVVIGTDWHSRGIEPVREILSNVTGESWRKRFPDTYDAYRRWNPEPDFDALARSVVGMWLDGGASGYPNEAVKDIACPLLVVRGDDDHLVSRESGVELCGQVKDATLLNVPFAGHVAFVDQKEIFEKILKAFLNAHKLLHYPVLNDSTID